MSFKPRKPHPRPRRYDDSVQVALLSVWKAVNRICSKRLVPFLPELVAVMERFGHLSLPVDVREKLLSVSVATVDRLLAPERHRGGKGISTTRPGALLKRQIPVRTFADWDEVQPVFFEADLVAHCGDRAAGSFLYTLTLTDIATCWTECLGLLARTEADVTGAITEAPRRLPFPMRGLDTDNGSDFINYELLRYCEREGITFTRSRSYKKNDQAHVEEKNGSVVRRLVGYDRFEGVEAWRDLSALYRVLRLYVNFFQPSLKLLEKHRDGAKTTKKYDRAQTPYQRLLASASIPEERKAVLRRRYEELDPVALLSEMERLQDRLWQHVGGSAEDECVNPDEAIVVTPASGNGCCPQPATSKSDAEVESRPRRMYRRTKKDPVPHTWRTRPDPFADVWSKVQFQLQIDPSRTAVDLLKELQTQHPGQFTDGQRRVRAWRKEHLYLEEVGPDTFGCDVATTASPVEALLAGVVG